MVIAVEPDRRILLLTGHAIQTYKKTHEIDLSQLSTFTSIYTYYFRKILEEMGCFEIHMSYFKEKITRERSMMRWSCQK